MVLNNGIELILAQNESVNSVNIGFYFYGGSAEETVYESGIHHLLEHMFFRRLSALSQPELYSTLNRIGATMRGATYLNFLRFDITVSPKHIKAAFDIILKFFSEFSWSEQEVQSEREVVLNQIYFSGGSSFYQNVLEEYLNGTGFERPIMGNESSVKRISAERLNKLKKEIITSQNAVVVVTGNVNEENREHITRSLSSVKKTHSPARYPMDTLPYCFLKRDGQCIDVHTADDDISEIIFSFDIPGRQKERLICSLVLQAFAAGNGAILPMALRENLHYTDEVYFSVDEYPTFSRGCISFFVRAEDTLSSINKTFEAMENFVADNSDNAFFETIPFFLDNGDFSCDDIREYNLEIAFKKMVFNSEEDFIKQEKQILKSITPLDFNLAKKKLFVPSRMCVSVQCPSSLKKSNMKKEIKKCLKILHF